MALLTPPKNEPYFDSNLYRKFFRFKYFLKYLKRSFRIQNCLSLNFSQMHPSTHINTNPRTQASMPCSPSTSTDFGSNFLDSDYIPKKRKSNFDDQNNGSPFLKPESGLEEIKKRSFFRDNSYNNLVLKARQLQPAYQLQLINIFNIRPSNQEGLFAFLESLRQYDKNTIMNVTKAVDFLYQKTLQQINREKINQQQQYAQNQVVLPKLGPIFSYDFNDVRYGYCEQENLILKEPIPIGMGEFNIKLQIPNIPEGFHVVIQTFIASVAPPIAKWPQSLIVIINGHQVKAPGPFFFPLIDTFDFGPNATIQVHCSHEPQTYAFLIRLAKYQSLKELVSMIKSKGLDDKYFNPRGSTIICPLKGKLMKYPGKGIHCTHSQCFDLKEYMRRAIIHRNWVCPICRQSTPIQELLYSTPTYELIHSAKCPLTIKMPMNPNKPQQITQELPTVLSQPENISAQQLPDIHFKDNDDFNDTGNFDMFDDMNLDFAL